MDLFVLFLIQGAIFGGFCAYLASQKERDGASWFLLGFLFSIIALLVLIGSPRGQRSSNEARRDNENSPVSASTAGHATTQTMKVRLCPHCIQEVHERAAACPHCQRDLPEFERCSHPPCNKIINPTDERCEDEQGNPYCCDFHRRRRGQASSPEHFFCQRWRPHGSRE